MFVIWTALNGSHPNTTLCDKGDEKNTPGWARRRLGQEHIPPSGNMARHLPTWRHSNNLNVYSRPHMNTSRQWWLTSSCPIESWSICPRYLDRRGQTYICQEIYSKQYCRPSYSLDCRRGWWPPYRQDTGRFLEQGGLPDEGQETSEVKLWKIVLTPLGVGYAGGRYGRGGGIHHSETEYGSAVHCDAPDYSAMQGGGLAAWVVDIKEMVGAVMNRLYRDMGGGKK